MTPRHFHLLNTPKRCPQKIIPAIHLSPPWYGSMPGQTLRSDRSHRVYTGYIVRYGEIPPTKKLVNSKSLLRKRRVLSPYMRPNQSCFFYYSSGIEINHDLISKKRDFAPKSPLWSTFEGLVLLSQRTKSSAVISFVRRKCALGLSNITKYAKKVLGEHKIQLFQSPIFITFLCISRSRFLYWMPPDHRSHETLISGPIV